MINIMPGETIEKLMNINQWAPSTTPMWMYGFFSWLVNKNLYDTVNQAVGDSPKLKKNIDESVEQLKECYELCKQAGINETTNPTEAAKYMKNLPEYQDYMQLYKKGQKLEQKIREHTEREFERNFEESDKFFNFIEDRLSEYIKQNSTSIPFNEQHLGYKQFIHRYQMQFHLIYDSLNSLQSELGPF